MKLSDGHIVVEAVADAVTAVKAAVALLLDDDSDDEEDRGDHRRKSRNARTQYDHAEYKRRIDRDFLGPTPKVKFNKVFRISKERFMAIHEDIKESKNPFFFNKKGSGACPEARMLLPLKCLAFGLPPHAIAYDFGLSDELARECCVQFDNAMCQLYVNTYMRQPSADDLRNITELHNEIHGVRGMYGSLDCMHHVWKNCPTAWKGSFQGKEGKPTLILEGVCDYNLWFWNSFYGCAGSFNDLNVLRMSNLMTMLLDGTFADIENRAGVVPYNISGEEFDALFLLVDGIYPKYSRFVKGIKDPITEQECGYTGWQEAARKDIERAFGVLQCRWQFMRKPIELMDLGLITQRVKTCLILHNMGVSDRVMNGDVTAAYNPAAILGGGGVGQQQHEEDSASSEQPHLESGEDDTTSSGVTGVYGTPTTNSSRKRGRGSPVDDNGGNHVGIDIVTCDGRWGTLSDPVEHNRLHTALMNKY
jgi:hypothetical protein